jgi:hypothetical protein
MSSNPYESPSSVALRLPETKKPRRSVLLHVLAGGAITFALLVGFWLVEIEMGFPSSKWFRSLAPFAPLLVGSVYLAITLDRGWFVFGLLHGIAYALLFDLSTNAVFNGGVKFTVGLPLVMYVIYFMMPVVGLVTMAMTRWVISRRSSLV